MGRRCFKRRHEFCADVDVVLRAGKGLTGMDLQGALREEARREGKNATTEITSIGGGLGATTEEDDGRK